MAYDLAVIGGGPGGYVCAIRAAQLGLKTLCIERAELGGICLNWGCIPTKALMRSAELLHDMQHAEKFGLKADNVAWDFSGVVGRSRQIAGRLNKGIQSLFKKYKVEHLAGVARLLDAHTIEVQSKDGVSKIEAKNVVIATGARPKALPDLPLDGKIVITSREAMILPQIPKRLVVVGAGAIGMEFAYFYSSFGSQVTVVEFQESILPLCDREMAAALHKSLTRRGIEIFTGAKLAGINIGAQGVKARVVGAKDNQELAQVEADICLSAVGMLGNVEQLGLEQAGVRTERGFVAIDPLCHTNVPNIFAIGDVAGMPLLAHKASAEGHVVAEALAGKRVEAIDKNLVPACTYTHPQLANVGLTEEQCKARNLEYVVGRFPFSASGMALAAGDSEGLVKLLFGKKHGELLGAHILCGHAADLIAELVLAMKQECTYEELVTTIHAHPTLSEAVMEAAAQAFGQAIHI